MSQQKDIIEADVMGRIMSLEQRLKGLQGRISALEIRLSRSGGNDSSPVAAISEDTEFFPAVELSCLCPEPGTLDARLSALEQTVKKSGNGVSPRHSGPRAMDTTGVIAGAILVGAGLLLYTGNTEIIKNPILSLACGSFLIVLSLLGRNWYNAKLTKTVE